MKIQIYKITSPNTDQFYIGMTTRSLKRRLAEHITFEKYNRVGRYRHCTVFNIIRAGDPSIALLEEFEADNREAGHTRETFHINEGGALCCNKVRTTSGKAVHDCPCGGHYSIKWPHLQTVRHTNYLATLAAN